MKPGFNAPTLFILALVSFFLPWVREGGSQFSGLHFALNLNYIPNYVGLITPVAGLYFIYKGNLKNAFIAACVCLGLVVNWYLYIIPFNDLYSVSTRDNAVDGMASNFIKSKIREFLTFGFYLYAVCSVLLVYLTASEFGLLKSRRPVEDKVAEGSVPSEAAGFNKRDQNTKARLSPVQRSKAKPVSIDLKDPKIRKVVILALIGVLGYGGYSFWDKTRVIQIEDPYAFAMEFSNDSLAFMKKYMNRMIEIELYQLDDQDDNSAYVLYPARDEYPPGFGLNIEQVIFRNKPVEDESQKKLDIRTNPDNSRKYVFYSPTRGIFLRENSMIGLVFKTLYYDFKYPDQDPYAQLNGLLPSELTKFPGYNCCNFSTPEKKELTDILMEGIEYMELNDKTDQILIAGYVSIDSRSNTLKIHNNFEGKDVKIHTYYSKFKVRARLVDKTQVMLNNIDIIGEQIINKGVYNTGRIRLVLSEVSIISRTVNMDPMRKKTIKLADEIVETPAPAPVIDSTAMSISSDSGMNVNVDESQQKLDQDGQDTTTPSTPTEATIVVDNAFFHSEPDLSSKTTKFLIRDDIFKIINQTSEFYYAEFTNDQTVVTRGWILKSEASVK